MLTKISDFTHVNIPYSRWTDQGPLAVQVKHNLATFVPYLLKWPQKNKKTLGFYSEVQRVKMW